MGTTTITEFALYNVTAGQRIASLSDLEPVTSLSYDAGSEDQTLGTLYRNMEFEGTFTIRHTRMTRKRLVKLLISCGYSRNEANAVAQYGRALNMSYGSYYMLMPFILDDTLYRTKK